MVSLHRQRGVTALGWLVILFLIGFFVLLGLKIIPIYMDHYRIKEVMESLKDEPLQLDRGSDEIRKLMEKRLKINYVWDLKREDVKIVKTRTGYDVTVDIDSRENIFGNLDVAVRLNHTVSVEPRR
ncbi:MAG: DUF4845 domain-containing protein [Chromatiales bacterium]|nr:DUF4845 domain-containing protein [Chromatiales bacterium]